MNSTYGGFILRTTPNIVNYLADGYKETTVSTTAAVASKIPNPCKSVAANPGNNHYWSY